MDSIKKEHNNQSWMPALQERGTLNNRKAKIFLYKLEATRQEILGPYQRNWD